MNVSFLIGWGELRDQQIINIFYNATKLIQSRLKYNKFNSCRINRPSSLQPLYSKCMKSLVTQQNGPSSGATVVFFSTNLILILLLIPKPPKKLLSGARNQHRNFPIQQYLAANHRDHWNRPAQLKSSVDLAAFLRH